MACTHDYSHGGFLIVFTLTGHEVIANLLHKKIAVCRWFICLLAQFFMPFLGGETEVFLDAKCSSERCDPCVEVRLEEKGHANFQFSVTRSLGEKVPTTLWCTGEQRLFINNKIELHSPEVGYSVNYTMKRALVQAIRPDFPHYYR